MAEVLAALSLQVEGLVSADGLVWTVRAATSQGPGGQAVSTVAAIRAQTQSKPRGR